jgi:hypothetical protein
MSDYASSLPARTESAGDVDVFVSDATTPSQKEVNADGSINITDNGGSITVDGTVAATQSGTWNIGTVASITADVNIADGGNSITVDGTVAATQSGTWDIGTLTSITNDVNIADGGNSITVDDGGTSLTVDAVDLDIRDLSATSDSVQANLFDETGTAYSVTNPLPVEMVSDAQGVEVCNYNTSAAVAKDASVNHDYTVTATKTLLGGQAWISGSGKLKAQLLVNGVVKFVGFNSTANPNIEIPLLKMCKATTAQVVRMTITNLDNGAQDIYSTLLGVEV